MKKERNLSLIVLMILGLTVFLFGYFNKKRSEEELKNLKEIKVYINDSVTKEFTSGKKTIKYYAFQHNNYLFYDRTLSFDGQDYIDSTYKFNDTVLIKTIQIQNNSKNQIISLKIKNKQLIEENAARGDIATDNAFTILISIAIFAGSLIWYFSDY